MDGERERMLYKAIYIHAGSNCRTKWTRDEYANNNMQTSQFECEEKTERNKRDI